MVLWLLILLIISTVTIEVHSQLDYRGFVHIDCGLSANSSYVDPKSNLTYVSDEQFIDTGVNYQLSVSGLPRVFETVRSFPTGIRNCYTFRSLTPGFKYIIRAQFIYSNYDSLNRPPTFDIYLGINYWDTVNADSPFYPEIIVNTTKDYLEVCLVNKNLGNPFISTLNLRQLNSRIYPSANATQSLIWVQRADIGGGIFFPYLRYPLDKYDRLWFPEILKKTIDISTNSSVESDDDFEIPATVKQSATTTSSTKEPLNLYWNVSDKSSTYYWILHFYEIQNTSTDLREFDILINGVKAFNKIIFKTWYWTSFQLSGYTNYNVSLVATSNSTLPPILSGYELYKIAPKGVPTYDADVTAMNSIKKDYLIKNGWSGDPCLPKELVWSGVNCTSNSNISRITGLNLSSSGLIGPLSYYFGSLSALVSLDLSSNNLSGSVPSSLDQLTALTYLDVRGNKMISTSLPYGLQKKHQNGSLTYRFGDIIITPSPSPSPSPSTSSKKNILVSIAVVVPLLVIAVFVATVFWLRKKHNQSGTTMNDQDSKNTKIQEEASISSRPKTEGPDFQIIDNRQFSYNDVKRITDDFQNMIGKGGFGDVYFGLLENGFQVAVKMRSHLSSQGVKEFLAEANHLARVHHKNLVTLIGYCIDENCMALVYEYMPEGNLQAKLKDDVKPLTWKQRLRIAYQSALGLEYLHKACSPPLIHRDVKASNILLNANLEAKIADFGLSRAFGSDATNYVSTRIIGTLGYLDPEYFSSNQLSVKSDVYSFGVVLLEIVTGQSPTNAGSEGANLVQWVRDKLSGGNIESIVDPKMEEEYDINSIWKVTDLACRCTELTSSKRPTMNAVVSELKESMHLEFSTVKMRNEDSTEVTDVSQDSAFERSSMGDMPEPGPSVR